MYKWCGSFKCICTSCVNIVMKYACRMSETRTCDITIIDYIVPASRLRPQNMCESSTRGLFEGYVATPNFPSLAPHDLYDCSCNLRPQSPSQGGMEVTLVAMYARLPDGRQCAEQTWAEDQVSSMSYIWTWILDTRKQLYILHMFTWTHRIKI